MTEKTNAKKLRIEEGFVVWVISSTAEESSLLDPLPRGARMVDEAAERMDAVVLFVEDRESLVSNVDEVMPRLGSASVIWISYPHGIRTDIGRDSICELIGDYGWRITEAVTINDVWSAVRLSQL